ncbi:MAG: hypothetical protein JKY42_02930, partial [Flavobacteriales bacterium]|nr:hypothetical protein [Flavobacteriales bacterium]
MTDLRIFLLALIFSLWAGAVSSQGEFSSVKEDCITVQEITVPFDGKQFNIHSSEDQGKHYNLVYYADEDEYTFWYKLVITQNC